jgi:hypothetical protein
MEINTPVTLWYRKNQDNEYEFNHLEDGHVNAIGIKLGTLFPAPKHENHKKTWSKGVWICKLAYMKITVPTVIEL